MAMLGVPQPVTEALLNHKTGVVSGVAAIYNVYSYADEKREALETWNARIEEITKAKNDPQSVGCGDASSLGRV